MSNAPALAQRRAAHALDRVKEREATGAKSYGNYVAYAAALPATILTNGLGQAAATLLAKKKPGGGDGHGELYADLQSWLCDTNPTAPFNNQPDLMRAITSVAPEVYFRAQAEALAYLVWLKKFAKAFLEQGKPD
jgi:CRISPR-associated protein Cmr5